MTGAAPEGLDAQPKFHRDRSGYLDALAEAIARAGDGADDVEIRDLEIPAATGFSNETVLFRAAWTSGGQRHEDRLVARIEPDDGALFPTLNPECAVSVTVQRRVMEAVGRQTGLPVPAVVAADDEGGSIGRPFFVMRHVDGRVPADHPRYTQEGFVVDATPEERRAMVLAGIEAMSTVHRTDWRAAGLGWLDPTGTGAPTTADHLRLYREYAEGELAGRDHPVLFAALDWLDANDPGDDRIGVSWGDARLGNIIWDGWRPAAVVDWEAAALCPTEADVGWWLMYDRACHEGLGVERLAGYPTREEQVAHYEQVSGRDVRAADYWEVFATMRFSAIFVRLNDRMSATGMLPEGFSMAQANQPSAALADLLGIDNPYPSAW